MEVIETVQLVLGALDAIRQMAVDAQENKAFASDVAQRVCAFEPAIRSLEGRIAELDASQVQTLGHLKTVIIDFKGWLTEYTTKSSFTRWFKSASHKEKLEEVTAALTQATNDLQFANVAQQVEAISSLGSDMESVHGKLDELMKVLTAQQNSNAPSSEQFQLETLRAIAELTDSSVESLQLQQQSLDNQQQMLANQSQLIAGNAQYYQDIMAGMNRLQQKTLSDMASQITDEKAAQFWDKNFADDREVPWSEFKRRFEKSFNWGKALLEDVEELLKMKIDSDTDGHVSNGEWDAFTQHYPPPSMMARLQEELAQQVQARVEQDRQEQVDANEYQDALQQLQADETIALGGGVEAAVKQALKHPAAIAEGDEEKAEEEAAEEEEDATVPDGRRLSDVQRNALIAKVAAGFKKQPKARYTINSATTEPLLRLSFLDKSSGEFSGPPVEDVDSSGIKGGRREGADCETTHYICEPWRTDPTTSKFHFCINADIRTGSYYLQDSGSLTGTFVRLQPGVPVLLRKGALFRAATHQFEVVECRARRGGAVDGCWRFPRRPGMPADSEDDEPAEDDDSATMTLAVGSTDLEGDDDADTVAFGGAASEMDCLKIRCFGPPDSPLCNEEFTIFDRVARGAPEETKKIGRHRNNDLAFFRDDKAWDPEASKFHCRIVHRDGKFYLEDGKQPGAASTHGTYVRLSAASETSQPWLLADGTVVRVGADPESPVPIGEQFKVTVTERTKEGAVVSAARGGIQEAREMDQAINAS